MVPEFSMCCREGRIKIAYPPLPEPLTDLYYSDNKRSKYFMENIQSFNSMFAFTSIEFGATMVYLQIILKQMCFY